MTQHTATYAKMSKKIHHTRMECRGAACTHADCSTHYVSVDYLDGGAQSFSANLRTMSTAAYAQRLAGRNADTMRVRITDRARNTDTFTFGER